MRTSTGPSAADTRAAARRAVAAIIRRRPAGGVSVAALDVRTGRTYSAGATSGMWMASTYKLYVLETLLLRRQGSGGLSSYEQSRSVPMIEQSDNVAGYALWEDAGGNAGLAAACAARALGVQCTVCLPHGIGHSTVAFMRAQGAKVIEHGQSYPEALQAAKAAVAAHEDM